MRVREPQAAARSSLQAEIEARTALEAERTELCQQLEQMREERGGWQERLKTAEERLRALAAAELKAAAAEAAEQKATAAGAAAEEEGKHVRIEFYELPS